MKAKELFLALSLFLVLWSCTSNEEVSLTEPSSPEYLNSWNEGPAKQSIIEFVEAVTTEGSPEFVAPEDRIATFDNDGNLWAEQPFYFQLKFGLDQVVKMAPDHPEWMQDETLKAAADGDLEKVLSAGEEGLLKIIGASHSGMTSEEFALAVNSWINTARHPKTGLLYREMVYQPMLEVLDYLRDHGFKTFIVSGGGVDFMRPWTNKVYGIPAEQVVGSSLKAEFKEVDGKYVIMKIPELNFIDDKAGKPVGIHQHIGKRPIAAFGNSDGDLQMLQYSSGTNGRSFQMYIHHTDSVREWAYDRESHIGRLDKGLDEATEKGWTVVDMAKDWKVIYPSDLN